MRRKLGESDLVQETYLAAFEDLDGFEDRGPGSFVRWLETVFRHQANDQVKRYVRAQKRSAKREVSTSAADAGPTESGPSPSSQAVHNEEREALRRAIDAMTGDDRRVLELVHEKRTDFVEAGRAMGRSPEAVRKLYGRAVRRLSEQFRGTS
jgi:RNA polymerase sigma-70 factor (ECF subfamily)